MDEAVGGDHLQETNDKEDFRPQALTCFTVKRVPSLMFSVTSRVPRRDELVDQGLGFGELHCQLPTLEHGPVERLDGCKGLLFPLHVHKCVSYI